MAEGEDNMKKDIHPEVKECTVTCACGATFQTKSIKDKIDIEVCSECHPFNTGRQGSKSRSTNIEKFKNKYKIEK